MKHQTYIIKLPIPLLILLALFNYAAAQISPSPNENQKIIPYHKLYLNTDRDFYFTGDTVWFSGYILHPQTHVPEQIDCNLYIELVDRTGNIVQRELFLIEQGFCAGHIILNTRNLEGIYLLRAYTDLLKALGGDFIFSKAIRIIEVKNLAGFSSTKEEKLRMKINVELFPEGGFLLAGKYNRMAFKVTDPSGRAVAVTGKLQNIFGDKIAEFSSVYNGMGIIHFIPEPNIDYFLEIDGYPNINYKFPEIREDGAKLKVRLLNEGAWNLNIVSNNTTQDQLFYLAFLHRGELQHFIKIPEKESGKTIRIKKKSLQNGINRLVLMNQNYEPVSERLVFADKNESGKLLIKLPQSHFRPRDEVELQIEQTGNAIQNDLVHFSIAVIDENAIPLSGVTQNIKSYLLIDSELRGYISNPADYFRDDPNVTSAEKQILLLLTHGWSNYTWNYLDQLKQLPEYEINAGLNITGTIKNSSGKKIIADSEVILSVAESSTTFLNTTTSDSIGNYIFKNVFFYDSATVIVQGTDRKNKLNTTVTVDSIVSSSPTLSAFEIASIEHYPEMPVSLLRTKYFNEAELKEFYPNRNSKWIEEVKVTARKSKKVAIESYKPYTEPTYTVEIKEEHYAIPDVVEYLHGRIPGFGILMGKSSFQGAALFLIDGIPVFYSSGDEANNLEEEPEPPALEIIRNIPLSSIKRVEVLKHGAGASYGMQGANGVVNIILKKGGEYIPPADILKGTIVKRIKGFSKYRKFYSPDYTDKNRHSEVPDYRTTLYWNPLVTMAGKNTSLSFFTCDNQSSYKILVEGISENGQIYLGEAEFKVIEKK